MQYMQRTKRAEISVFTAKKQLSMNVVKFATKYCAFLKRNLAIKSKCGSLKILCNQCGPLCSTGFPPLI